MGIFSIFQAKKRKWRYKRLIEESVAEDDEIHGAEKGEEITLGDDRLGHRRNAAEEDKLMADSKDLRLLLHNKFLRLLEEAELN